MKNQIRCFVLEYLKEEKLQESGFARIRTMMHGLVETVNTIGILSTQNPGNDPEYQKIKQFPIT